MFFISLISIFLPVLLWILFIVLLWKVRIPTKIYFSILIFSFLAVIISSLLETILISIGEKIKLGYSFTNLIIPAIIEELIKLGSFYLIVKLAIKTKINTWTLQIFAVLFALLFATFETIAYTTNMSNQIITRILTATIFHAGVSPFYVTASLKKNKTIKIALMLILLHIVYNLTSLHTVMFFTVGFGILLFCFWQIVKLFSKNQS